MEYKGFKIDFMALTALVGAVTGLWMAVKGKQQRTKNKERIDEKQPND